MPGADVEPLVDSLAFELRLRGCSGLRSELRARARDCWPLIEPDPCPSAWATRWQEVCRGPPAEVD
jgi:hypothetical protein